MTDRNEIMGLAAIAAIIVVLAIIVSIVPQGEDRPRGGGIGIVDDGKVDESLKKFDSQAELSSFIKYSAESGSGGYGYYGGPMMMETTAAVADSAAGAPAPTARKAGADEFSATNIQVEGVDEADIVKNDGKYIYVVSGNKVVILDAYPPEDAEILSEIEFKDESPSEIYINEDRLIVFTQDYNYEAAAKSIAPYYYGSSGRAVIHVYDISDREDPELEREMSVEGNYFDSRMIGDYVYVVVNEPIYYQPCYGYYYGDDVVGQLECLTREIDVPVVTVDGEAVGGGFPDVYYWDMPDNSYRFTTILAVNTQTDESPSRKFFVMGNAQDMFVSMSNIYVTRSKWMSEQEMQERVYDEVIIPTLPEELQDEIEDIENSDKGDYTKRFEKLLVIKEYIANLDDDGRNELYEAINDAMQELREELEMVREQTVVSRIAIRNGRITPKATGSVPGNVLNQFSMDEYGGNFRIATTVGHVSRSGGGSSNNVYVLNSDMEIIGELEDLAPGERIYSARFMGERCYLVTFKKVDPLFVIDMSEPENPTVLGKLKIPGYSDYLHPYDENHLIGIGKGTVEAEEGDFAWYQGVKLSLFDVSNVEKPKELDKYEIGDRGTDSTALHDHKAFLFSRSKNLLVVPILLAEIDEEKYPNGVSDNTYGDYVWQGAYVFDVTLDGFELRGTVSHADEDEFDKSGYYYNSPNSVKRSLYMDDVLYTISDSKVLMNDLNVPAEKINEVELPYEGGGYYPEPYF